MILNPLPLQNKTKTPTFPRMSELISHGAGLEEPDYPAPPGAAGQGGGGRRVTLVSEYQPAGDQPTAIAELTQGITNGEVTLSNAI